jgi:hypothetical protein
MKATLLLCASALALAAACSCASETPEPLGSTIEAPAGAFDQSYAIFDGLLSRYVKPGGVDYKGLAAESDKLDTYLASLQAVELDDFQTWSNDERFAFWANAYNGYILRLITANYPVESIRDLGGKLFGKVWDHELIPLSHLAPEIDHELLSFNDVEHGILRPVFADARVHAAVNCASASCPPLAPHAFVAVKLDAQLDAAMDAFVQDPIRNHLNAKTGDLELSSIFDWFGEDFERDAGSVRAYIKRHAGPAGGDWIDSADVSFLDYSWSLNDVSE